MTTSGISEVATEYYEKQAQLREKREELSTVRADVFATDSEEVEQKARNLFDTLGVDTGSGQIQRIDELEAEISELRDEVESLEVELWEHVEELRLPFEQSIDSRDSEIVFEFSESLSEPVVRAMTDIHPAAPERVTLETEAITVETDEVGEAISAVEEFVTEIRETARENIDSKPVKKSSDSSGLLG